MFEGLVIAFLVIWAIGAMSGGLTGYTNEPRR